MKKKRNPGKKSLVLKPLLYFFATIIFLAAISICFSFSMLVVDNDDDDLRSAALRKPASYSRVSDARWERYPEAKIEFDNLKQILFGVVDNTKITPKSNSFSIDIYDFPHCIIGISINQVVATIPFSEVVHKYITWATSNGWHYEENKTIFEHSGEILSWYHLYTDPANTNVTQTWFMIESLSVDTGSAIFQAFHPAHYKLHLAYIDHSCDED